MFSLQTAFRPAEKINHIINRRHAFSELDVLVFYNNNNNKYYYYYYHHANDSASLHPSTAILTVVKGAEGNTAPLAIM